MKIKSLHVDGYGVWSKLKLDQLDDGIHVLYGPNEAGKTTLMQFLRSMFFGFSTDRRRYLPPVYGGRPGGTIQLSTNDGAFRLSRHDDDQAPGPRATAVLAASDGTRHGESYVESILSGTDESIFNNVFCLGLREIQELGIADDTEAAALLFNLTAGLDRVALVEVLRELDASRQRLLAEDGTTGQIVDLVARRDEILGRIAELDSLTAQYGQLSSQQIALSRDAEKLDEERSRLEQTGRVLEAAIALRDRWNERNRIDSELASLNLSTAGLEDAFERFNHWDKRLSRLRRQLAKLDRRRTKIRRHTARIKINDSLQRQAARVEAFREQEGWITSLQTKVADLQNETKQLGDRLAEQRLQLGLDPDNSTNTAAELSARASSELRRAARLLRRRREAVTEARSRFQQCENAAHSLDTELQSALAEHGAAVLGQAIESAGNLMAALRRHLQLSERLDQMERHHAELEERSRDLLGRQVLSLPTIIGLGAVFVFSVVLIIVSLATSASVIGSLRWPLTILGIGGVVVTMIMKVVLEKSNFRNLDACQKQIQMLQTQITQGKDELADLDRSLPAAASRSAQLDTAQNNLTQLEELTPLDARRKTALQETETAKIHLRQVEEEARSAKTRWVEALDDAGLPKDLAPKQLRQLLTHRQELNDLARRVGQANAELRLRQSELDSMTDRITQLATEADIDVNTANPIELLRLLSEAVRDQQARIARRKELRTKARRLRRARAKLEAKLRPLRQRRRRCLAELGVRDSDELVHKREKLNQAAQLQHQRRTLQTEIETAIVGQCTEAELAACLADASDEEIEARWDGIERDLQAIREQSDQCIEQRGQIKAQLAELAEDRRGARKRLELSTVEQRLTTAVRRWQVLALTGRILTKVKDLYEKERQPETLREASEYLRQLTGGRYVRVWTPLGEDVLRVDTAKGEILPVEVLSQGTREQLFLSLRLSLVACYARRGIQLPLILDDVLVNFDAPRAKAAASLLRDFARSGHQLLVFTCHDHIVSLFKSLNVDVRRLPNHRAPSGKTTPPTKRKKTKHSKSSAKRRQNKRRKHDDQFHIEQEMSAWEEDEPTDGISDDDQSLRENLDEIEPDEENDPSPDAEEEDVEEAA